VSEVVVWGIGELGAVFARGLLRSGHSVVPVVRGTDVAALAARIASPALVLVAVGETELDAVLSAMPDAWKGRVALLQNELRPRDWGRHGLTAPTLAVVWFEKKRGTDVRVLLPTIVAGQGAALLAEALSAIDVPCDRVSSDAAAHGALAAKNLYILVTNLAGLVVGGNVGALLGEHRAFALELAGEVLELETALFAPHVFARADALAVLDAAGAADPQHACMGRSAPTRLARCIAHADALGLAVPVMRRIAADAAGRLFS
jgi:hypothetical protein